MSKRHLLELHNLLFIILFSFQFAWIFSLILAKYISSVEKKEVGLDFLLYYSAGYIIRYDSPEQLYDLSLQRQVQATIVPEKNQEHFYPYNHPPILAPLMGWVVTDNYLASYLRWVICLVLFQLLSLGVLLRLMIQVFKWKIKDLFLVILSGFFFYPAIVAFIRGQDSSFFLLGICLWVLGLIKANDKVAGLGLAMALIRPQIALVLAFLFLFKKQRILLWFLIWSSILLIYCYLFIGWTGLNGFIKVLIFSGQGFGFDVEKMATLMGAILRWFPGIDPSLLHIVGYLGYFLAFLFLCIVWVRSAKIGFSQINIAILCTILFAPHFHGHDLLILLIPSIGVAFILSNRNLLDMKFAALIPVAVSVLLIVGDIGAWIFIVYLVIISLALLSWRPEALFRFLHFQRQISRKT
jgi:hypothetical protein